MARKTEIQATMLLHAAQIHQIYVVENEPASSCTLVWFIFGQNIGCRFIFPVCSYCLTRCEES